MKWNGLLIMQCLLLFVTKDFYSNSLQKNTIILRSSIIEELVMFHRNETWMKLSGN